MKRFLTILAAIFITTTLFAQSPDKMSFQAVVRDNNNNLIVNSKVGIRISILQNSIPVYFETQTPATNANGLISIEIGEGSGFNTIDWGNGPYFIKTEIDPTEGKNYTITGTSQLMSVPYAFHSKTANYLVGQDNLRLKSADPGVGAQSWSQFGNAKTNPLKDKLGTTDPADMVFVTSNIERLRIKSDGKINLGFLEVGDDLTVKKNVYLNTTGGETTNSGTLTVNDVTNLKSDLNVDGDTYLSGSLTVSGTTSMEGKASMGGGADFDGAVVFKDIVIIEKGLAVNGGADFNGSVEFNEYVLMNNGLTVSGTTDIKGKATMTATDFSGQVTISATVTGGEGEYGAYPLRVQGSEQGISIKVNGGRDVTNNYITFWDEKGIQGRIEGETSEDLLENSEYKFDNVMYGGQLVVGGLDVLVNGFEFVQGIADLAAACSSVTGCAGLGAVVCSPIPSLIAAATTNLIVKTASLAVSVGNIALTALDVIAYNAFKHAQIGVTYQSGGADYAEWLPKANLNDNFLAGEIVGVKAGKISRNTVDADKVMVVSKAPVVLGNMQPVDKQGDYEKIAFMGQVPVRVTGTVKESDYILPSGLYDGFGIAVSPENMMLADYQKIVGIAWSEKSGDLVNVAVGLNGNDVARYSQKLETKIAEQASELNELKLSFNQVVEVLKKYDQRLAAGLDDIGTLTTTTTTKERVVKYFKPNKKQIDDAITEAEVQMRAKYGEEKINEHPFFKDMKDTKLDPEKGNKTHKDAFIDEVSLAFDNEVEKQKTKNAKQGIITEKENL